MKTSMVGFIVGLCICLLVAFSGVAAPVAADISDDGSIDAVDVQLVINGALGVSVVESTDVDYSGLTDAVDVQLVINATLGIVIGDGQKMIDGTDPLVHEGGSGTVTVPNVVGLLQSDAERTIINTGLTVDEIPVVFEVYSDTVDIGCIVGLYPPAGSVVAEGTAVEEFYVSRGPESATVTVPDVHGLSQADAKSAIVAAGLAVGSKISWYSDIVDVGRVIAPSPFAGTVVVEGSDVDIYVSRGPEPVTVSVPSVRGMFWGNANSAILAVGLTLGSTTYLHSDFLERGRIISQHPFAGTVVVQGSDVDICLSLGPESVVIVTGPKVTVPDVVGMSQAGAESAIVAAGLTLGSTVYEYSDSVAEGDVISQGPAAGMSVAMGSSVNLIVSGIADPLHVVSTEVRLLEASVGFVTYSWKVDVQNLSGNRVEAYVDVNLYDSKGFLLATVTSWPFKTIIEGNSTVTITDTSLMEADLWGQVARYDATAYQRLF